MLRVLFLFGVRGKGRSRRAGYLNEYWKGFLRPDAVFRFPGRVVYRSNGVGRKGDGYVAPGGGVESFEAEAVANSGGDCSGIQSVGKSYQ